MHRGTAFFALQSCRVRVCSWTRLPPHLCRWFWKIGVCRRTSGWHALSLKHLLPAAGQIMGFTLETGIFCLFPGRRYLLVTVLAAVASVLVPALQGMKWVMISPRKQQTVEEDCWKKYVRRRRPSMFILIVHGPIQLLFKSQYCETECPPLSILGPMSSTSACYWDPEVAFLRYQSYDFPLCVTSEEEYTATALYFSDEGESGHHVSKSTTTSFMISPPKKYNSSMRLPVWRFGWGRNTVQEHYGTVLHRTSNCGDDCWIEHGIQVCPTLYVQWIFSVARVLILFVFWNVKPGRITLLYGRKFCCQRNIKRQLRHNMSSPFHIMGQIQVLAKSTKPRREKWIAIVPPHRFFFATLHTRTVVPQFQNSLVEMCHEAEVSLPSFINSLVVWIDAHCKCQCPW